MIDTGRIMMLAAILAYFRTYEKAAIRIVRTTAFPLFCFFQLAMHHLNASRDNIGARRPHALGTFIQ